MDALTGLVNTEVTLGVAFATIVAALAVKGLISFFAPVKIKRPPATPKQGSVGDVIRVFGVTNLKVVKLSADLSPYVSKLETWLRMAGIPYHKEAPDFPNAPRGKVPYIRHGDNVIGDSSIIISYLRATYGSQVKLTSSPTDPRDQAVALMLQRTLEDHFYWGCLYFAWLWRDGKNVSQMHRNGNFNYVLAPFRPLLASFLQSSIYKACWAQGLARNSEDEILEMLRQDLAAVSTVLGDKLYLFGEQPYDIDACAFGFLDGTLNMGLLDPLKDFVQEFPNLVAYVARIRSNVWKLSD